MQSLIAWLNGVQLASAVDQSPALNRPCLRAWTQLTYFLSFSTSSVFPLYFAMSKISYFIQCPKCRGGGGSVNNFKVTLVSLLSGRRKNRRRAGRDQHCQAGPGDRGGTGGKTENRKNHSRKSGRYFHGLQWIGFFPQNSLHEVSFFLSFLISLPLDHSFSSLQMSTFSRFSSF